MKGKRYIQFDPEKLDPKLKMLQPLKNVSFKCQKGDCKVLSTILEAHGLVQAALASKEFALFWTGSHLKPDKLTSLKMFQRINHFPRSYELTRKDRLYKNLQRMQDIYGQQNFDFIPVSFILPLEYKELVSASHRMRSPWIVKPVASSRGRGIYLTYDPADVPLDEPVIVSKYIDNPLLIDGNKCDFRLYVVVTSYDPLVIYFYREGIVRCATVKYTSGSENMDNPCVHLCNYSINKYHSNFRTSPDLASEDGHKRSLTSFLRKLRLSGADTAKLMSSIEDLVVKTISSVASQVSIACKMFVPHPLNCFELYGFDILIDSTLKPWLLEVNFSPSLGCETTVDMQIKSALLCDLLNLVGIEDEPSPKISERLEKIVKKEKKQERRLRSKSADTRPRSLTQDGIIVSLLEEQHERRGDFVRIFPTESSWSKYCNYADTGLNRMLHELLFPEAERAKYPFKRKKRRDVLEIPLTSKEVERLLAYERPFEKGYVSKKKPVVLKPITAVMREKPSAGEMRWVDTLFEELKMSIESGNRLTAGQARKLFSRYLNCILNRLPSITKDPDGLRQIALVDKFVLRVSCKQRVTNQKTLTFGATEDRLAFVSTQLKAFIDALERDTKETLSHESKALDSEILDEFCNVASETDFERLLAFHTEIEPECSLQFLFGKRFSDRELLQLPVICEEGRLDLLKKACSIDRRSPSRSPEIEHTKDGRKVRFSSS